MEFIYISISVLKWYDDVYNGICLTGFVDCDGVRSETRWSVDRRDPSRPDTAWLILTVVEAKALKTLTNLSWTALGPFVFLQLVCEWLFDITYFYTPCPNGICGPMFTSLIKSCKVAHSWVLLQMCLSTLSCLLPCQWGFAYYLSSLLHVQKESLSKGWIGDLPSLNIVFELKYT